MERGRIEGSSVLTTEAWDYRLLIHIRYEALVKLLLRMKLLFLALMLVEYDEQYAVILEDGHKNFVVFLDDPAYKVFFKDYKVKVIKDRFVLDRDKDIKTIYSSNKDWVQSSKKVKYVADRRELQRALGNDSVSKSQWILALMNRIADSKKG